MSRRRSAHRSSPPHDRTDSPPGTAARNDPRTVHVLFVLLAALIVAVILFNYSPDTALVVLTDGVLAAAIVASATGLGLWIVVAIGLGGAPLRWQILLGAGLGLGGLMLLMLAASWIGWLGQTAWMVWLAILFTAGIVRVVALSRRAGQGPGVQPLPAWRWLWLAAMPALAFTLLVAAVPPGFLWLEEARGYDVLEYHLGAPKEYLLAGRNHFLPHNVYANFPFNVEMLYLLAMVLDGDPWSAASLAKMLNAMLGILTIASVWLAGRECSPRAGVVAGVVAATLPWLMYLSGICFVENGMLFFGALSLACLGRWFQNESAHRELKESAQRATRVSAVSKDPESREPEKHRAKSRGTPTQSTFDTGTGLTIPDKQWWSWPLASGLLAGLSAGCKYTAVVMFALPLGLAWLFVLRRVRLASLFAPGVFTAGALLTMAPWLVKNVATTGNPVFPLAYSVFGARDDVWNAELDARWRAAHRPTSAQQTLGARLSAVARQIVAEKRFNAIPAALFALAMAAVALRPARFDVLLGITVMVQLLVWALFTHLYARFSVPLAIPLALMCGRAVERWPTLRARQFAMALVCVVALTNVIPTWRLYHHHLTFAGTLPGPLPRGEIASAVDSWVNAHVPPESYVLLVGDARAYYVRARVDYCVVFNRNPFAEAIAAAGDDTGAAIAWLQERGYTHVAAHWVEMDRLNRTYGFWPELNRETFAKLEEAGLRVVAQPTTTEGAAPFATVYEVPAP